MSTGNHRGGKASDSIWVCANPACNLQYDNTKRQNWIVCAICEGTYDTKCLDIDSKCYQVLSRNDVFWLCNECRLRHVSDEDRGVIQLSGGSDDTSVGAVSIEHKLSNLDHEMAALTEKQREMAGHLSDIKFSLGEVEKSIKVKNEVSGVSEELSEILTQSQSKWSDIVKNNLNEDRKVTVEHVKKALVEISESDREHELRSRGIVIYNAEEKEPDLTSQKRTDIKLIEELLEFIGCGKAVITEAFRMGKFDQTNISAGKFRPIKLRLSQSSDRDSVLKNLYRLKNANANLKKLSIREDLTIQQRNELNEKLKEARDKSNASEDKVYRVRGTPGNYRLIEQPKNLKVA